MKYQLVLPGKSTITYNSRASLVQAFAKSPALRCCLDQCSIYDEYGNPVPVDTLRRWFSEYEVKMPANLFRQPSRLSESKLSPAMLFRRLKEAPDSDFVQELHEMVGSHLTNKVLPATHNSDWGYKNKSFRSENGRSWKCGKSSRQWQRHHKHARSQRPQPTMLEAVEEDDESLDDADDIE